MPDRSRLTLPITLLLIALLGGSSWLGTGAAVAGSPLPTAAGTPGARLPALTGTHYVYVDDGISSTANSIDEFSATSQGLTYLGTVSTYFEGGWAGMDLIALAPATSSHGPCLLHSDFIGATSGAIESYSIDPATGLLTPVSIIPEGGVQGPFPGEVKVSPNGNDVYLSVRSIGAGEYGHEGYLAAFPLQAGCVLGPQTTYSLTNYQRYYSLALPDATHLFAPDARSIHDDVYTIIGGVYLILASHTHDQVNAPMGAAAGSIAGVTYTFNGAYQTTGAPVQANTFDSHTGTLGPVPGSPQGVKNMATNGETNLYLTPSLGLLTEVEGLNNVVLSFQISGGRFSYRNTAPLESTARYPDSQTGLGRYLLVVDEGSGTLSACVLASTGVSGCQQVATLTGGGRKNRNFPSGVGAF